MPWGAGHGLQSRCGHLNYSYNRVCPLAAFLGLGLFSKAGVSKLSPFALPAPYRLKEKTFLCPRSRRCRPLTTLPFLSV